MREVLGPGTTLGYCTNVHPGTTYNDLSNNLRTHAAAVKSLASPDAPMAVGLWIPAPTARTIHQDKRTAELAELLQQLGLIAYTINGFPYGDFHQQSVKHQVYQPNWSKPERLEYTLTLADTLAQLLPKNDTEGSISTLPLAWAHGSQLNDDEIHQITNNLVAAADHLKQLEDKTGKLIHLDLEPEPGCALQTSADVVGFYQSHLDRAADPGHIRRYIRVCHDVCHAEVMFEDQAEALNRYRSEGIPIGKIQLSSAIRADFTYQRDNGEILQNLRAFAEQRYLHQMVTRSTDGSITFYEDLPDALDAAIQPADNLWRVHFHVPLFVDHFGHLQTTNQAIKQCLSNIQPSDHISHFEIETYAWDVLPSDLRSENLANDIAREFKWVIDLSARQEQHHSNIDNQSEASNPVITNPPSSHAAKNTLLTKLMGYVELARVSNLPTCATNVLVGCALGSAGNIFPWLPAVTIAVAICLLYTFGIILNDILDTAHDRIDRPQRPIPSGRVSPSIAWLLALASAAAGLATLYTAGIIPMAIGTCLCVTIVFYNLYHRHARWPIYLLGGARALTYIIAAISVTTATSLNREAYGLAITIAAYVVALSFVARDETQDQRPPIDSVVAVPFIPLLALIVMTPTNWWMAATAGAVMIAWLARGAFLAYARPFRVPAAIRTWIAGICLVDVFFLVMLDRPVLAIIAVGAWAICAWAQKRISGT